MKLYWIHSRRSLAACAAFGTVLAVLLLSSCESSRLHKMLRVGSAQGSARNAVVWDSAATQGLAYSTELVEASNNDNREAVLLYLESLAEMERSGTYVQGMGLRESMLRENLGDFTGAVAAVYKELAWAYGMGQIGKIDLEASLHNAVNLGGEPAQAAQGLLAFVAEQWPQASALVGALFADREPDFITQWIILCCNLEQNKNDRQSAEAYRAIRARFEKFPEYWYRGARCFTGTIAAEYAERCIALSPSGPFADECRRILASLAGLNPKEAALLRSKTEIEFLVTQSITQNDPEILSSLMPLMSLPENSYTVYAVGVMRALAAVPAFRNYFRNMAGSSSGRLAERLVYICQAGS